MSSFCLFCGLESSCSRTEEVKWWVGEPQSEICHSQIYLPGCKLTCRHWTAKYFACRISFFSKRKSPRRVSIEKSSTMQVIFHGNDAIHQPLSFLDLLFT